MFDATKGNKALSDHVDESTNEFAALFNDLKPRRQQVVVEALNKLLQDEDALEAFLGGQTPSNNGSTPTALPPGQGGGTPDQLQALRDALDGVGATDAQKAAIAKIVAGQLSLESDGTPSELASTRAERNQAQQERDAARQELSDERDDRKDGSLAKQLAERTTERDAARSAASGIMSNDVKARRKAAKEAWGRKSSTTFGDGAKLAKPDADAIDAAMADVADDGS